VFVVGRHDDDYRHVRPRADTADHVEAAQAGHLQIEQQHVGPQPLDRRERGRPAGRFAAIRTSGIDSNSSRSKLRAIDSSSTINAFRGIRRIESSYF
jgi:hypothetical protein